MKRRCTWDSDEECNMEDLTDDTPEKSNNRRKAGLRNKLSKIEPVPLSLTVTPVKTVETFLPQTSHSQEVLDQKSINEVFLLKNKKQQKRVFDLMLRDEGFHQYLDQHHVLAPNNEGNSEEPIAPDEYLIELEMDVVTRLKETGQRLVEDLNLTHQQSLQLIGILRDVETMLGDALGDVLSTKLKLTESLKTIRQNIKKKKIDQPECSGHEGK